MVRIMGSQNFMGPDYGSNISDSVIRINYIQHVKTENNWSQYATLVQLERSYSLFQKNLVKRGEKITTPKKTNRSAKKCI